MFVRINPSDYSFRTQIDPPLPFAYEIKCLHVNLETLEHMIDPHLEPLSDQYYSLRVERGLPFNEVEFIELDHAVSDLTLFEFNRSPFFGFLQSDDKIVLVDPGTRQIFVMTCADHPDHIGEVCLNFFRFLSSKEARVYFFFAGTPHSGVPRPPRTKGTRRCPHGLPF